MLKINVELPDEFDEPVIVLTVGGVLRTHEVKDGINTFAYPVSDLVHSDRFTIGQIFLAVARFHDKQPTDYKNSWIKYLNEKYEVSKEFIQMDAKFKQCSNDFQRLNLACTQLGEFPFKEEINV